MNYSSVIKPAGRLNMSNNRGWAVELLMAKSFDFSPGESFIVNCREAMPL